MYLFIIGWAGPSLLCRLSLVAAVGAFLRGCAQASHCSGFSCCGAWAQLPGCMWDLSSQTRIEPVPSALAGGLLTNGPTGKALQYIFLNILL